MQRIAVAKASSGMVLARAVRFPDGLVLVGEGQKLTETIIDRIRAAGTGTIWVEGNPLGPDGDVGDLRKIAKLLPYVFRRHKDNIFMMTLRNVFARHFAKRIAEQQALEDAAIAQANLKMSEDSGSKA